ncbi:amino-acid oxidase [Fusarium mexicanum]|uniref:Amino-acid oxidase n=1 Tax=Fusarium mexicanum TaxID=751941 RepID=A0A8H5IK53_9HYPO|nr:amino-acid oxidase [Fusarium mexicanum]
MCQADSARRCPIGEQPEDGRDQWPSRTAYLLALCGGAVGMGNMLRYPSQVYNNHGLRWFVPYRMVAFLLAIPAMALEIAAGNVYRGVTVVAYNSVSRRMKGIGFSLNYVGFVVVMYFVPILASAIAGDTEDWFMYEADDPDMSGQWVVYPGISLNGRLVGWNAFTWARRLLHNGLADRNGYHPLGRGVSLPNASEGIKLYFASWHSSKLAGTKIWRDAVGRVFFSTGVGFGCYTVYASYNRKFANAAQDAVIIVYFNSSFEALCAFAVFGIVGYLGMRTEETGEIGSYGLGFMTYPEAFVEMPASGFFSVIFFFTIMLLGISPSFAMLDTVMMLILHSPFARNWSRPWVATSMVTICFLLSLPHCTEFGYFFMDGIDRWINNISLVFVVWAECVGATTLYRFEDVVGQVGMPSFALYNVGFLGGQLLGIIVGHTATPWAGAIASFGLYFICLAASLFLAKTPDAHGAPRLLPKNKLPSFTTLPFTRHDLNSVIGNGKHWSLPFIWAPMLRYVSGPILAIIFSLAYPSFEEVKNDPLYILGFIVANLLLVRLGLLAEAVPLNSPSVKFISPSKVSPGSAQNVILEYSGDVDGHLTLSYGACGADATVSESVHHIGSTHIGQHPLAKRHLDHQDKRPTRFVWLTSDDISSGCLSAFLDGELVGQSDELDVVKRLARRGEKKKSFADVAGDDSLWFDGVAYLKQKQPDDVFVAATKHKTFGILGGGMSGLLSSLILDSVGIHNWKILESSERIGGRVRTVYLNGTSPEDGQYHELGPMRFPYELTDSETNETFPFMDQRMIFQLADVLNGMNGGNKSLQVEFWDWIQSSPNTPVDSPFRRPDGTWPTKAEVANDPAYYNPPVYHNATAAGEAIEALDEFKGLTPELIRTYASNIFKAYKQAKEDGAFDYSEVSYLRDVIKTDLNTTDEVSPSHIYWPMWEYETIYFLASKWVTIKGGLSRLPAAFEPHVKDRVQYNAKVNSLHYNKNNTLSVFWKPTGSEPFSTPNNVENFDYVLNSVPLNLMKFWKMPRYSSLLKRAIDRTLYANACKVAVQFKTRFWEHLDKPIIGGCTRLTSPQLGQVCYPSWHINSTGPGTMLASYLSDYEATAACTMSEEEHLAYIKNALIEVHGDVVEENWTGNYKRQCWEQEEHHAGAFTMQIFGQQHLYLPAFYQTEFNTVFIGEAATFTHTWIFSALESAVRGSVQLLLDLGLVDEAKQVTQTWMARWIDV